ncbi:MAG: hypothetical protein JOZ75_12475 [Candidatus Dormibacteraeota bacterium]|nr:hypothetical protein [Candidatus Dormibacteraeota bacterium]
MARGLGLSIGVLFCCGVLTACAPGAIGGDGCTAGRFDSSDVGPASTPDEALSQFLTSLDAAGLPQGGWQPFSTTSSAVVFRSGSSQATAVRNPDGWGVIAYTTCAT